MPLALAATFPAILRAVTTLFAVGSFISRSAIPALDVHLNGV
jgi:hypothetical protein